MRQFPRSLVRLLIELYVYIICVFCTRALCLSVILLTAMTEPSDEPFASLFDRTKTAGVGENAPSDAEKLSPSKSPTEPESAPLLHSAVALAIETISSLGNHIASLSENSIPLPNGLTCRVEARPILQHIDLFIGDIQFLVFENTHAPYSP